MGPMTRPELIIIETKPCACPATSLGVICATHAGTCGLCNISPIVSNSNTSTICQNSFTNIKKKKLEAKIILPKITETSEDEISKLINSNEEPEVITDAPISDLPIEEPKPEEPKLEQTQTLDDLRNRLNNIRHK